MQYQLVSNGMQTLSLHRAPQSGVFALSAYRFFAFFSHRKEKGTFGTMSRSAEWRFAGENPRLSVLDILSCVFDTRFLRPAIFFCLLPRFFFKRSSSCFRARVVLRIQCEHCKTRISHPSKERQTSTGIPNQFSRTRMPGPAHWTNDAVSTASSVNDAVVRISHQHHCSKFPSLLCEQDMAPDHFFLCGTTVCKTAAHRHDSKYCAEQLPSNKGNNKQTQKQSKKRNATSNFNLHITNFFA